MKCLFSDIYLYKKDAQNIKKVVSAITGAPASSVSVVDDIVAADKEDISYAIRQKQRDTQEFLCYTITDDRTPPIEDDKEVARKASSSGIKILAVQEEIDDCVEFVEFLNGEVIKKVCVFP